MNLRKRVAKDVYFALLRYKFLMEPRGKVENFNLETSRVKGMMDGFGTSWTPVEKY